MKLFASFTGHPTVQRLLSERLLRQDNTGGSPLTQHAPPQLGTLQLRMSFIGGFCCVVGFFIWANFANEGAITGAVIGLLIMVRARNLGSHHHRHLSLSVVSVGLVGGERGGMHVVLLFRPSRLGNRASNS